MDRKEIVNSQDYKATKVALCWYPALTDEEREDMDIIDAYADGVIYGWNNPHWIPVEEELPPKMDKWTKASDYVLVYTNEGEWLIGRYWHDGDGWSVSGFTKAKVTHWMPIVPPRKEE